MYPPSVHQPTATIGQPHSPFGAPGTPASQPAALQPQPAVADQAERQPTGGVMGWLGEKLRPADSTTLSFMHARTSNQSKTARGEVPLAPQDMHVPKQDAHKRRYIQRRQDRAAEHLGDASTPIHSLPYQRENAALAALGRWFAPTDATDPQARASRERLLQALTQHAEAGTLPYATPLLLGRILAQVCAGDAHRALGALAQMGHAAATGDGFRMQLKLASCLGPGFDCLWNATQRSAPADPVHAAVQREAFRQRLLAAGNLCDRLPAVHRPANLQDCLALAREVEQKLLHPATDNRTLSPAAEMLLREPIVTEALLCADNLVHNPGADAASARQKAAYFAHRNGITRTDELNAVAAQLHGINKHIDRAAEHGFTALRHGVERKLLGKRMTPLAPMVKLGAAGSGTRHPADDVKKLGAMDDVVDQLNARVVGLAPADRQSEYAVRMAVNTAVVRHWKHRIVNNGWSDALVPSGRMRDAIVADVAQQLGVDVKAVEKHPTFRSLKHKDGLTAQSLKLIVERHQLTVDPERLRNFMTLHNRGEVLLENPTRADVRQRLLKSIADTRQTYNVNFDNAVNRGVNLSIVDILGKVLNTAGAPSIGVGPAVSATYVKGRNVDGGSNVHGGELRLGKTRGGAGSAGVTAALGWGGDETASVKFGLFANIRPIGGAYTATDAVVARTRMDTIGSSDPDAWRHKLLRFTEVLTQGLPDAQQTWDALAGEFFKDPNLSVNRQSATQSTLTGTAGASVASTVGIPGAGGVTIGPNVGPSTSKTYRNTVERIDTGSNRTIELSTSNGAHAFGASVSFAGSAPGVTGPFASEHDFGATHGLSMPTAAVGASVSGQRDNAMATYRIVTDQGRVQPNYSVVDTQVGSARRFCDYIDSQRAAWIAALGGGAAAVRQLDEFLSQARANEDRGNMTYGERRWMTPDAARRVDALRAQIASVESHPVITREDQQDIQTCKAMVSDILKRPDNWDCRSLWVLGVNQETATQGPDIGLLARESLSSSAVRQERVLIATHAPNRDTGPGRYFGQTAASRL